MDRILIIQTAFIGDVILATGIVEKLHRFFPGTKIDFLLRKGNESLFDEHPFINEVIIWDKQNKKYANYIKILKKIRHNHYQLVINIQRYFSTGLLTLLSGAENTTGFDKNPFSFIFSKRIKHIIGNKNIPKHEIERNNDLIENITDNKVENPKLYIPKSQSDNVKNFKHIPYICIAPTSVWETKQFPPDKWIEFINLINDIEKVYLLGASSDFKACEKIREKIKPEIIAENLCGKLNFLQSAALMKDARMNYVNDSAPMHLASAVNAPVSAIFCSTVPEFGFGPVSQTSYVIETNDELNCRPCGLHGHKSCPEKHFKCAYSIKSQQLLMNL